MKAETHVWHALSAQDVLGAQHTDPSGLAVEEAARRLRKLGTNELARKGGDGLWRMLWRQLNNPIGWLLLVAGVVAVVLNGYTDAGVVFGAVFINAITGIIY